MLLYVFTHTNHTCSLTKKNFPMRTTLYHCTTHTRAHSDPQENNEQNGTYDNGFPLPRPPACLLISIIIMLANFIQTTSRADHHRQHCTQLASCFFPCCCMLLAHLKARAHYHRRPRQKQLGFNLRASQREWLHF